MRGELDAVRHQKSGFPLGFDPVADPDQVGERDSRVQLSEFSCDQSFFFIHSFAFIISTTGNPEGLVRSAEGVILYAQILFSPDV